MRRRTRCQLTLVAEDGTRFDIAFDGDAVIAATSPLMADSAMRIALTSHFLPASQTRTAAAMLAQHPEGDEVALMAQLARLDPAQTARLRRRVVGQRAARTFAIDRGHYVLDSEVTLPIEPTAAVDVRGVMYTGIRLYLSEERLSIDVQGLGTRYVLRPDATLEHYGFTGAEDEILDALRKGTTLVELETVHRELDPRIVHAVIYALVACDACEATHRGSDPRPQRALSATRPDIEMPRARRDSERAAGTMPPPVNQRTVAPTSRTPPTRPPPMMTPPPQAVPEEATFAQASEATAVSRTKSDQSAQAAAAEAFRRGMALLRQDQVVRAIEELTTATQLAPNDIDHEAMLAWAQFCAAGNRAAVADKVRKSLSHAIHKSANPELSRFYLGRVERMLGRNREALAHFHEILLATPKHAEALAEVRAIEARLASGTGERPSVRRKKP